MGKKELFISHKLTIETRIASLLLVASTLRCMYFPTLNHFIVYKSLLLHIPCFLVSCTFNSHLLISGSLWLVSSTNEGIFSHSSRQCVCPFLFPLPPSHTLSCPHLTWLLLPVSMTMISLHVSSLIVHIFSCRFILRNYIAQNAISAAEKGDFTEVN